MNTSHVGSVPLPFTNENIRHACRDMLKIGISAPPYPQLRSFIDIFLEPLKQQGILEQAGTGYYVIRREYEKPRIVVPVEAEISIVEYNKFKPRYIRGPVTGPFTLASRILRDYSSKELSNTMIVDKDFVKEVLVAYIAEHLGKLNNLGYDFLVVDDPMLANIIGRKIILYGYKEEELVEIYESIFKYVQPSAIKGIHVCGELPPRLPVILSRVESLNVLNHEFKDSQRNLSINWREILEHGNKVLAPGVISSKKPRVESIEETVELLRKIASNAGEENIDFISADCGFAALTAEAGGPEKAYSIVLEKWHVLVEAVSRFRVE